MGRFGGLTTPGNSLAAPAKLAGINEAMVGYAAQRGRPSQRRMVISLKISQVVINKTSGIVCIVISSKF
jgi:hypothetical protein